MKLYENNKIGDNGAEDTGECGSADGEESHGTQLGDQAQPLHEDRDITRTAGQFTKIVKIS